MSTMLNRATGHGNGIFVLLRSRISLTIRPPRYGWSGCDLAWRQNLSEKNIFATTGPESTCGLISDGCSSVLELSEILA